MSQIHLNFVVIVSNTCIVFLVSFFIMQNKSGFIPFYELIYRTPTHFNMENLLLYDIHC